MPEFDRHDATYTRTVDLYSRYISSPGKRLKFLRTMLNEQQEPIRGWRYWLKRLPFLGSLQERALLVVEVSKYLPAGNEIPFPLKLTALLYRIRIALYTTALLFAFSFGVAAVYIVGRIAATLSVSTQAKEINTDARDSGKRANTDAVNTISAVGSKAGLPPEKVWLAERGAGYEFYSNGARILTEMETAGDARRFYLFNADAQDELPATSNVMSRPAGIVFHISESDIVPFTDRNNSSLKHASRGLLEYARDHRLYNYVIDRFGRTYRVVRDEFVASHAGNSLWGVGKSVYINLSASFIGVCFEGKYEPGGAIGPDAVNEPQIIAARMLTAVLRSKYGIEDEACVTHGLVSINPSNKLMGYHTDWVAGFPFEAMGLSNKSASELLAVSRFGFTYDQAYLAAAGGSRWPGLERAEARLRESADKEGLSVEQERVALWRHFQRAYAMQHALDRDRARVESEQAE